MPQIRLSSILDDIDDDKSQKIFVNICVHEEIGAPGMKKRLDENGEEVEGMNIPMSVGAAAPAPTSLGSCVIYDIIVNQKVLDESTADKSGKYRDFVCQLGMQCLEQKYNLQLDRRYKLPKSKYMYHNKDGKVDQQYIKDRKSSPQIEEVTSDSSTAKKAAQNRLKAKQEQAKAIAEATKLAEVKLPYRFVWVKGEGWDDEGVDGPEWGLPSLSAAITQQGNEYQEPLLQLPEVASEDESDECHLAFVAELNGAQGLRLADVVIKASPYRLTVKVARFKQVSVYVPFSVDAAHVRCRLTRRSGFTGLVDLKVVLPLDLRHWSSAADPGSKQWLMEAALKVEEDGRSAPHGATNPYSDNESGKGEASNEDSETNINGKGDVEKSSADLYHLKAHTSSGGAEERVKDSGSCTRRKTTSSYQKISSIVRTHRRATILVKESRRSKTSGIKLKRRGRNARIIQTRTSSTSTWTTSSPAARWHRQKRQRKHKKGMLWQESQAYWTWPQAL